MKPLVGRNDLLPLSGIQHMAFCERQWALIHVEQQWTENSLTAEGRIVHERADDYTENENRVGARTTRSVPVISRKLGLRGIVDVVEYIREDNAPETESVVISGRCGRWRVVPVEYKRGRTKPDDRDQVQLCAYAIALEEMMHVVVNVGYLYYNAIRRRQRVSFSPELRTRVDDLAIRMHTYMQDRIVPSARKEKHCQRCSLYEICQPGWPTSQRTVRKYIDELPFREDEACQ